MHQVKLAIGFLSLILLNVLFFSSLSFAQSEDQEIDTIEAEIKTSEVKLQQQQKEAQAKEILETKVETLADLSKLSEFSDVAVMQKRYMPKTGRFQMNAGIASMVNDPWNQSMGVNLRAAYNLTEYWGLEAVGFFMSTQQTSASTDLFAQHNINARTSFGSLSSYYGGNILWTPIYGKFSLFNQRIIPFDMYFTGGAGTTNLDGGPAASASTFSIGTGQIFSLTRSVAFRWDLTWNMYSLVNGSVNNILLTFGASFYIPEVSYR